jgi:ferredoxin-type protein NapH
MSVKRIVQFAALIIHNSFIPAFFSGGIYQGVLKRGCTPILNCWGCPLAWYSCPLGALQHFIGLRIIPFYILGFFGTIGMIVGRMSCGWVCPFGLLQDLLYKIKSVKMKLPNWCSYIKYAVLIFVAVMIPYFVGEPWFCKLCPNGHLLAGIPLVLADKTGDLRALVGWHFYMKGAILVFVLLCAVSIKRFFCRTFCPIGAIYSIFNRLSLFKIKVDKEKCIECESCQMVCPMHVPIYKSPEHRDCIRCLDCVKICPTKAISYEIR